MSGIYGTIRPANINISEDVEMFYMYHPTRSTTDTTFSSFKKLNSNCLVKTTAEIDDVQTDLLGMYELHLPLDKFNKSGFYTIYIRPKEIICNLKDVSVLSSYPNIKGIVVNVKDVGSADLTGYRVEYFNNNTNEKSDNVKLITSCNRCTPVLVSVDEYSPKSTRYRLDDTASNYYFCTLTPSSSNSFKPNVTPYIGTAGEQVAIINTKFNPIMIEVEMVEHDMETLSYMLEGDQIRDRDNATITTYNKNKEIYHQHDYFTVKSSLGTPLYDVKRKRESIDGTITYDNIINEKTE